MNDLALNSLYVQTGGERSQLTARDMSKLLRDHIFEVLGIALAVTALALAYMFVATPVYESDVLVRVDPPEPSPALTPLSVGARERTGGVVDRPRRCRGAGRAHRLSSNGSSTPLARRRRGGPTLRDAPPDFSPAGDV